METVLVMNTTAYAAKSGTGTIANANEINELAPGAIVFVTPDGAIVPDTGFGTSTQTLFQMVLQTVGGGLWKSPLIERDTFKYLKEDYAPYAEKIQTLDFTGAGTTAGKSAGVTISPAVYVTPLYGKDYEEFTVPIKAGQSIENLIDAIVVLINAGSEYVTAAKTTATTMTITGKAHVGFETVGMYEFETYTSVTGTEFDAGHGLSWQIAPIELKASAHKGNEQYKSYPKELYPQEMQTIAGQTYDTFDFTWKKTKFDQLNSNDAPYNQLGMLAANTSNTTLIGVLEVILASV